VVGTDAMEGLIAGMAQTRQAVTLLQPDLPHPRQNVGETNGCVPTEASVFTGSGFVTEHPTVMTEVMSLVVETSVALRKSLPAIIKSVFPRNNVAMATMTVVTTAMKGIVQPTLHPCVERTSFAVAAVQSA